MSSYKEASERMAQTGNGLTGIEYTSFQEYVVKNVCRYYFDLDPILKDRPNVTQWATNEDTSDEDSSNNNNQVRVEVQDRKSPTKCRNESVFLSTSDDSDDDSLSSSAHKNNIMDCLDSDIEIIETPTKNKPRTSTKKIVCLSHIRQTMSMNLVILLIHEKPFRLTPIHLMSLSNLTIIILVI